MSEPIRRESPLARFKLAERAGREPGNAGVQVGERPFLGHLNLRGEPSDSAFLQAVQGVLGFGPPLEPNTAATGGGLLACWLGPNEWLLMTPGEREADIASRLRSALGGLFAAVTEVGSGQTVITLAGTHARDLLAKGCILDLHPRVFGPGRCAQSLLGKAPILIRQVDDKPTFELVVRRSFADYLWRWLEAEAEEYGLAVVATPESQAGPAGRAATAKV